VNIDPSNPVAPVSEPSSASAALADRARGGIGPYYTQGMPEDVNALKREVISVSEFVQQSALVQSEGVRMLDYALDRYLAKEEGGLFFFYFSGVDLCSHMMWRHFDASHPDHDPALAAEDSSWWSKRPGSTWKDYVYDLYMEMDPVLGRLRERLGDDATLIVMSDHGFAPYSRKFSLNTWLLENGYLVLRDGCAKELPEDDPAHQPVYVSGYVPKPKGLAQSEAWPARTIVDWSKTRAYGVGFNGLYLNLAGREQDDPATADDESGIVKPEQAGALARELKSKLEALVDPKTGARFIARCDLASEVFTGARVPEAPDVIVGYDAGYGNSDEAAVGRIPHAWIADNDRGGTFNGSHLMVPDVVRGMILCNRPLAGGEHGLEDLTVEILRRYQVEPPPQLKGHAVLGDH
jgi:predicted AlkP superfamily phosphohydrolase/phosphomutase